MATASSSSLNEGETLEKAKRELNEDPETREVVIGEFRQLIEEKEGNQVLAIMVCKFLLQFNFQIALLPSYHKYFCLLVNPLFLIGDPELAGITFERKDGPFLLRFLRARKFDKDRSLTLYLQYHIVRRDHPEIFAPDFSPSSVTDILSSGAINVLDGRMNNGAKV